MSGTETGTQADASDDSRRRDFFASRRIEDHLDTRERGVVGVDLGQQRVSSSVIGVVEEAGAAGGRPQATDEGPIQVALLGGWQRFPVDGQRDVSALADACAAEEQRCSGAGKNHEASLALALEVSCKHDLNGADAGFDRRLPRRSVKVPIEMLAGLDFGGELCVVDTSHDLGGQCYREVSS